MVSASDILLRIRGRDETGNAFKSVEGKASQMKNVVGSAVGMAVGMVGYDLVNSMVEAGRAAINSSQKLDYFGGRLNMSAKETDDFRNQIDNLQRDFRKVDMTAVGATAEEIAVKMDLPKNKVGDLTKMTAVLSSTFVKEGRTQEDAVLAVGDALDGQFKRLQEIGITQDALKANGWNGNLEDQASLIDALNKTMENMGYEQTAKDITNLDEAWTALSIAGGRLLADVIIPLTPAFMAVTDAIIGAIDFVKDNGWAQGAILIGGLAIAIGLFAGALTIAMAAEGGLMALMPGFITSLWGVAGAFMGISVAGAPLWAILAVIAAIAFAVYEVGIYFGWWTDIGSMLAALSDGVRRLWEAFVNSPQVQGAIKMVQGALNDLWTFLQPMISWIQTQWENVFGKSGGNPDAVRMIWQAFQKVGDVASAVFPYVVQAFQTIGYVVTPLYDMLANLVGIFSNLANGSISWQDAILQVFTSIITGIANFQLRIGQIALQIGMTILNRIVNAIRPLPGRLWAWLTQSIMRFIQFRARATAIALQAGRNILNGIINRIRQIPGRVGSFMMRVPGRIASAAGAAVGAAASLASQVLSAVTNGIIGVGDAVYNEFINIGSRINSAVSGAVDAAASFGSNIKDAVLSALQIASPGIIQRKIAIEFADIPGRIGESSRYVYNAARDYAGNILGGFNAPTMNLSTLGAARNNANYTPTSPNNGNTTIVHVHEGAVPVDARDMTEKEAQGVVTLAFESIAKNPEGVGN